MYICICECLRKKLNAPGPSEHPPVRGKKNVKRLGGTKGCKYKTSPWHLNGFPVDSNIGSTDSPNDVAYPYGIRSR